MVRRFIFACLLVLAVPALARVEPMVLPGGDIPRSAPTVRAPRLVHDLAPSRASQRAVRGDYVRREVEIPMRDGTLLHTVLVLPAGKSGVSIILDRTPYSADLETRLGVGPKPENILNTQNAEFIRAGYGIAIQDIRGKFRSGGDFVMNRPLEGDLNLSGVDESTDAFDTIDWLVKNVPESNGRLAVMGTSYNGWAALMALINPHPALKAVVAIHPMVDVWKGDDWFHNGAFRQEMMSYFYNQTASRDSSRRWLAGRGDDYLAFLQAGSADDFARAHAIADLPLWKRISTHPDYDPYWQAQAVDKILPAHGVSVPLLLVGGLWDQEDIYGAPALFKALEPNEKTRLVLGPWFHGATLGSATAFGPLEFGGDTGRYFRKNLLGPFLAQHLRGGPSAGLAPVTTFEAGGNRWERLATWPSACAARCAKPLSPLYLVADRGLGFVPPAKGSLSYVANPADPVPYRQRPMTSPWALGSTWRTWLGDDQRFAAKRSDVLTFTGKVLSRPLSLEGQPMVHLVASTSGTDSDWVVKLIDVFPADDPVYPGYQFPIAMEILRGRYAKDPTKPEALKPDVPQAYDLALPAVNYLVKPGHRLMVQVQSSWFPLYDRNPQTYVPNIFFARAGDYRKATQRVFTGPQGSWIGLPVVQ